MKWTCLVCKECFDWPKDIFNLTKKEKEEMRKGKGPRAHFKWIDYKKYVDQIMQIWTENDERKCPDCGKGGRKDGKCTHITCECKKEYCYFWGVFW